MYYILKVFIKNNINAPEMTYFRKDSLFFENNKGILFPNGIWACILFLFLYSNKINAA